MILRIRAGCFAPGRTILVHGSPKNIHPWRLPFPSPPSRTRRQSSLLFLSPTPHAFSHTKKKKTLALDPGCGEMRWKGGQAGMHACCGSRKRRAGAHAAATNKSAPNHRLHCKHGVDSKAKSPLILGSRDRHGGRKAGGAGAGVVGVGVGVIRSRSAARLRLCSPVQAPLSCACSRPVPYQSITKSRARARTPSTKRAWSLFA
jgi:hypothetical protein